MVAPLLGLRPARRRGSAPGIASSFPFSFGLFIGFWAGFEGARALGALAIPGGGQDTAQRFAALETLRRHRDLLHTVLRAPPRRRPRGSGGSISARLGVRATVHAGEPGAGIPSVRARIEAGWGARAYDHAGMTEMGAYGFECEAQDGLHVNETEFIAEVIDPDDGAPASAGELVLTESRPRRLAAAPLPDRAIGCASPRIALRVRPDLSAARPAASSVAWTTC